MTWTCFHVYNKLALSAVLMEGSIVEEKCKCCNEFPPLFLKPFEVNALGSRVNGVFNVFSFESLFEIFVEQ